MWKTLNKLLQGSVHALEQNQSYPQPEFNDLENQIYLQPLMKEILDDQVLDNFNLRPFATKTSYVPFETSTT